MIDHINVGYVENETDFVVTDSIGLVYVEIKIELFRPIWASVVCKENQTWQQCD